MTNNDQDLWVSRTSSMQAIARAAAGVAIGGAIMWMSRELQGPGLSMQRCAFALGVIAAAAGLAGLLASRESTIIDAHARTITVKRQSLFGSSLRTLRFDEISKLTTGALGEAGDAGGVAAKHFILAKLSSGQEVRLFLGLYDETDSTDAAAATLARLAKLITKASPA